MFQSCKRLCKLYNRQMRKIIIVAHDIRSLHNVGSILRTAEGLGITKVYLTGYTPHPSYVGDQRLPHIGLRQTNKINKTALGAEEMQDWEYRHDVGSVISELKQDGYSVVALEQGSNSTALPDFKPSDKIAIILGREVEGLSEDILKLCDRMVEIPMSGQKESFNVVEAATMAMYQFRFSRV